MTVREIARPFAMSLPAVSQHLKVLERAGLIARGRDGQKRPCRLNAERLTETARFRPSRKVKTMSHDPRTTWALEREIVLSRVIAAPRSRVFQAFTDPSQITRWFGPEGFTTQTLEIDIREGGAGGSSTPARTAPATRTAWCFCAWTRQGCWRSSTAR